MSNNTNWATRPYKNTAMQDDSYMKYTQQGDFAHAELGSRRVSMPNDGVNGMKIDHVGTSVSGSK